MFLWGDKYDVALVNRLVQAVADHAATQPRFVLLSDRARPGLDPRVDLRSIPAFWLDPVFLGGGCQTKLAMFEAGALAEDLPALYVDLDTVVTGDLALIISTMQSPDQLMLIQSAILPIGAVSRAIWRFTKGREHARGNSSILVFHPKYHRNIPAKFKELWALEPSQRIRPMIADDRFISWASQLKLIAIPNHLVVKFPTEFMSRVPFFSYLWALLPWVRSRRNGLIAVTLCGVEIKPENLLALPDGGRLTDRKGRVLIWSDFVLGKTRLDIVRFYSKAPSDP